MVIMLMLVNLLSAQEVENEFQSRTSFELTYKPIKKLKLSFKPELRFDETYSLDKYLIDTEASYKAFDFLSLAVSYRFIANQRKTKDTEYFNRFAYSATAKKDFNDFKTAFRLRYSNYADDEVLDKNFIRYKLSVKYDIPKCKLTPFVSGEAFQQTSSTSIFKMRYALGADYKLFKKNYLGVNYKLDYYNKEYRNRHILSVGYKIKL